MPASTQFRFRVRRHVTTASFASFVVVIVGALLAADVNAAGLNRPVPTPSEIASSTKLVNSLYAKDIADAQTPIKKSQLAGTIRTAANEEKTDFPGKYSLFMLARNLACEAHRLGEALAVDADLAGAFNVDGTKLDSDTAAMIAKSIRTPGEAMGFATEALAASDSAMRDERFDLARRFDDIAAVAARQAKSLQLVAEVNTHSAVVTDATTLFAPVKAARATLARNPDDVDAAAKLGRFQCLVTGDWASGLPLLARSSDRVLSPLARLEISDTDQAANAVVLADKWGSVVDGLTGIQKYRATLHAKTLYAKALPVATGLSRAKIAKRLDDLSDIPEIIAGVDEISLVALIDGSSELHILPDRIFWLENGVADPGRVSKIDYPTYINGVPWMPEWGNPAQRVGHDMSAALPMRLGAVNFDFEVIAVSGDAGTRNPLSITGIDPRDPVEMHGDSQEQVLSIPDSQQGCRWYKIRIFRKKPGQ